MPAANGSLSGLADDIRGMDVGDCVSRVLVQPLDGYDRGVCTTFSRSFHAWVSKLRDDTRTLVTHTTDALDDDSHVRCVIVRRTA